jgi:hypothetical protein
MSDNTSITRGMRLPKELHNALSRQSRGGNFNSLVVRLLLEALEERDIAMRDHGRDHMRFVKMEQRAERYGLNFVYGTNYADCLRMYGIPVSLKFEWVDSKGDTHEEEVFASNSINVSSKGKWEKGKRKNFEMFLLWADYEEYPASFTGIKDNLVEKWYQWETGYEADGKPSRVNGKCIYITDSGDKKWLRQVISIAVIRRIMEAKHALWLNNEDEGFCDPYVGQEMSKIINFSSREIPKVYEAINKSFADTKVDLKMTDEDKKFLAQDIIDKLSKWLHDMYKMEKRTIAPDTIDPFLPNEPKPFKTIEDLEGEGA